MLQCVSVDTYLYVFGLVIYNAIYCSSLIDFNEVGES